MTLQDPAHILIEQAREGDRAAFDELAKRHRARLKSFIQSRLGDHLRPGLDAEDVLQETLIGALGSIARFEWRGEDSFFRWLCGIAAHRILKAAGRARHEPDGHLDSEPPASAVSPSRLLRREERFDRLSEALETLGEEHRKVILLARIEKLRIDEIARRMKRSPDAVKKLLRRGLKKLRERFGETESLHLPDRSLESGEAPGGE